MDRVKAARDSLVKFVGPADVIHALDMSRRRRRLDQDGWSLL